MKLVKEFLETSSIHGLLHISSNTHFARVFWVFTVITGFSIATYIINESFVSWNNSPISTLIETKPIEELKFPNVTVCPPKETYTTLNYDLQKLEGTEIDDATRNELFDLVFRLYHELHVNDTMESLEFLIEENRFQNWYLGLTDVTAPPPMKLIKSGNKTQFNITTSSLRGSVQTIGFGESFEEANFVPNIDLSIKIGFEYLDNREIGIKGRGKRETKGLNQEGTVLDKFKNMTLMNIKIHWLSFCKSPSFQNQEKLSVNNDMVIKNDTTEKQIDCKRKPKDLKSVMCELEINFYREIEDLDLPLIVMPGFKLEWDEVDSSYTNKTVETDFSRYLQIN